MSDIKTDNSMTLVNALKRIDELETELESVKASASGEVEPVAFAISDTEGKVRPLSAFYVHEKLADKHIEGYEQEAKLHKVPLYTHPPAKVPEELWEALAGCVSCFNCPEWSDKCEEVERRATKLLNSTTPTPATTAETEWVKCEDKLPTEAEAGDLERVWVCSPIGAVWLTKIYDMQLGIYPLLEGGWYWKPTGLKRPEPPKEQ